MVSKNVLSVILLVTAFGLVLGPVSYFLQELNKSQVTVENNTQSTYNNEPQQPQTIQPIYEYYGESRGVVKSKEGLIIINAETDFGDEQQVNETIRGIDGVKNITLLNKPDNPGENGLYSYKIHLAVSPEDTEKVGYYLMTKLTEEPFKFNLDSVSVPAKVSFPPQLNVTEKNSGRQRVINLQKEVDSYIFSYTHVNQTSNFVIYVRFIGDDMNAIMAFEKSRIYMPPVNTSTIVENVTVLNITDYGAEFSTDYDTKVNSTELERALSQNGFNASVSFYPPKDTFQVKVNGSLQLVEKLNESGIKAQAFPGGAMIWVNGSLEKTMEAIRSVDPTIEYPNLTGSLTLISKQPADQFADLIPGNLTKRFLTGYVFVPGYNDTIKTKLPLGTMENEHVPANVTIQTIFGDVQHPVLVDVAY